MSCQTSKGRTMTSRYRYRCCWCGSFANATAKDTRKHILERHRMRLIEGLGVVEAFGTHVKEITRSRAATARLETNPGVSGEGDS